MFVDFLEDIFLGDEIYAVPPPQQRRLQLYDSLVVDRFNSAVLHHFHHNKIQITEPSPFQSSTFPALPTMQQAMNNLDEQIGRAIAHGEKICRKIRNGGIPFSAEYARLNKHRRFWRLLHLRRYGRRISSTIIRRLAKATGNISYHLVDIPVAKYQLKKARINTFPTTSLFCKQ